jgi:hypothetical protein
MITIILLTFLSLTVLLMGFMDIRLPFLAGASGEQSSTKMNNVVNMPERSTTAVSKKKPQQYIHYTSPANRGIFPVKTVSEKETTQLYESLNH